MTLSFKFDRPLLIGHRGFKAAYPENTMLAFNAAVKAGAKMVELDVHLTRDHELVVIHDETVNRTTNSTGPVGGYKLVELQNLDAGGWFHPRFSGEPIPTLKEVVNTLARKAMINIELKSDVGQDQTDSGQMEAAVMDLLRREDALSSVLISSFDPQMVKNTSRFEGSPPVAFISETADGTKTVDLCRELKVFSFHPNFRCLDETLVAKCHAEGIYVFPYNVSTDLEYQQALQMNIDGVIVDDPAGFKQWYLQSNQT